MDGAGASGLYPAVETMQASRGFRSRRVGRARRRALKRGARARVEQPSVQILVAVANIQMRTLKVEVEKGSM